MSSKGEDKRTPDAFTGVCNRDSCYQPMDEMTAALLLCVDINTSFADQHHENERNVNEICSSSLDAELYCLNDETAPTPLPYTICTGNNEAGLGLYPLEVHTN